MKLPRPEQGVAAEGSRKILGLRSMSEEQLTRDRSLRLGLGLFRLVLLELAIQRGLSDAEHAGRR
jgi:hypothetical protein